jgi:N-carbamoylputrescine amidase
MDHHRAMSGMTSDPFTVGLVQQAVAASKDETLARHELAIRDAARRGAQIICLQELFDAPYFCKVADAERFNLAEPIPGPTVERMQRLARELQTVIVVPIFEKRAPGIYHNSAAMVDADGSLLGIYRKMHIPDDPLFYEKFYFAPGDLGFRVIPTRYARLGVGICWDQWYPEAARLFALSGAEILLYPTAIGWIHQEKDEFGKGQHEAWQTMMRSHAIANGIWLGAPNRVGTEDALEFWGASFIVSPRGEIVARGGHSDEEIVAADCDLGLSDEVRTHWPFLRDRRIDAYGDLTRRWID